MADSKLSSEQVLARSFDPTTDKLKVDAEVTATVGQVEVAIDAQGGDSIAIKNSITGNELDIEADGSINVNMNVSASGGDNIAISDGTDTLAINPDGSINVAGTFSISTTGLATDANQTNGSQKTQLVDAAGDIVDVVQLSTAPIGTNKGLVTQSIIHGLNSGGGGTYVDVKVNPAGKLLVTADLEQGGVAVGPANPVQVTLANTGANATAVKVDGSAVTQPVSAASLPLPTGAATEATLSALNTKIPANLTVNSNRLEVDTDLLQPLTDTELRASPIEVDVMSMPQMTIVNAIESNAYNLNAAGYSQTSNIADDFILNHIELNFSTTQSRDITITLSNGTILWQDTGNTNLNIMLEDIDVACNGGDDFTIVITQTAGACSLDVLATVVQGEASLSSSGSLIQGLTDSGSRQTIKSTPEGHLEVAIHGPRNPFGSIHTERLTPIFQTDAVYGINSGQVTSGSGTGGSATASNSMFVLQSGTSVGGNAYIQSRKRLRYRAGQGIVGRFTAMFTTGVANSYQVAGFGHSEDGVYFGYKGADFGIIYNHHGVREIQELTITNAASGAGNVTVTLNGVANTIAVSASAVGSIPRTVYELSQGVYSGWKVQPNGAGTKLVFLADSVGNATNTFSVSGSGVAGTFAEIRTGAAVSETFVAQADWNGDNLSGLGGASNPSGASIDPTKLNVYQIGVQYLGAGTITFEVETSNTGNNAEWVAVHQLRLPNTLTQTSFSNPSFPFTASAYSTGSTTNLTVKVGSYAGFIEGDKRLNGNRFSYFNSSTSANSTDYRALFTVKNSIVHADKANQSVINILSINAAVKHTQPVVFYLIRNATLLGNPSFDNYASGISATIFDNSATTCTFSTQDQVLWTGHLGETGEIDHDFAKGGPEDLTMQPGESLTLAVRSVQNNVAWATGSINTREDQ